jgi:CRISPR/Cas system-associated exonuclease Cas4 (RecB family)
MNANAHFGSVTHKMIELISRGIIFDEESFGKHWRDLISKKESELTNKGLANIVPLKYFVTDFALKKNQLRNILQNKKGKVDGNSQTSTSSFSPEKKLANPDNSITGIADLVVKNGTSINIMDFKTGKIYTDSIDEYGGTEQIIKKEYEFQLKLYAYLYFLMYEAYPTSLFLVTLENIFIEIPFSEQECEGIYNEAISLISTTNSHINSRRFELIAKPSKENCKYCSYRPACNYYSDWLALNHQQVNDLTGFLTKVTLFNNDSLGLQLQVGDDKVLINGLTGSSMEGFENLLNKKITLYNVKKNKQSLNATANHFTIAYE